MISADRSKLFLFDIDGTLLSARGVPKRVMGRVLANRFPDIRYDHNYDFSGRTDPEIIEYLLHYDQHDADEELIKSILDEFVAELELELSRNHKPVLLQGVEEILSNLSALENACLGLVTGNIARGAHIKLKSVGLHTLFPVGGYGDDSKFRSDLPPVAISRAEGHYNTRFLKEDIWIIGDSIYDIACAKENNLRCLAVASGLTGYEKLAAAKPEFLEQDMTNVDNILNILLNG
jgi:phosphoglycolate phosphatase-like HAD superfamily hydrolase